MSKQITDLLLAHGHLDQAGIQRALAEQKSWGGPLGAHLIALGLITEANYVKALSTHLRLPAVELKATQIDQKVGRLVPSDLCEKYRLVAFRMDPARRYLEIAMVDPTNIEVIEEVRVRVQMSIRPAVASPRAIEDAIGYIFYDRMPGGDPNEMDLSPHSPMRADVQLGTQVLGDARRIGDVQIGRDPGAQHWPPEQSQPQQQPQARTTTPPPVTMPPLDTSDPFRKSTVIPGVTDPRSQLHLSVSARPTSPPPQANTMPGKAPVSLPGNVHITMDVPKVSAVSDGGGMGVEELMIRLTKAEGIVARQDAQIQLVLAVLVKKGILTQQELERILAR